MSNSTQLSEKDIVKDILKGDLSAKKYLYCHYARYLTGVCARYISDNDDVREVLQESFLKIFSSIHLFDYRGQGCLKAWLARIVVNESLKFLKKEYRFEFLPLSDENDMAEDETDIEGIPLTALHAMIRDLPVGYRTILNLYVFEEKSHKEIAALLGIKENTSASQYHRAKNIIAEKIRKYHNLINVSVDYER